MNIYDLHEIIALPTSEGLTMTQAQKICFVKSEGNYVGVNLTDGSTILLSRQLNELEAFLPNSYFIRAHQQFIVNKLFVYQYHKKDGQLILVNGEKIPVAVRKRKLLSSFFKTLIWQKTWIIKHSTLKSKRLYIFFNRLDWVR